MILLPTTTPEQPNLARAQPFGTGSDDMFRTVFRAIPDPASISKLRDGAAVDVLVDVNDALLELTGCTREQMIGRTLVDFGFCDEQERIRLVSNLLETGTVQNLETRLRFSGTGQPRTYWFSARLIDLNGERHILAVARDVTQRASAELEREKAERALRASESRLKTIFELAPDTYFLNDLTGIILDGNRASEALTGYSRHELIGKNLLTLGLIPDEELPLAMNRMARSAAGEFVEPQEFTVLRKDGKRASIEIRSFPTEIDGKRTMLVAARDITDRRRAELALKKSEESLGKAQRMAALGNWELDCVSGNLEWSDEVYRIYGVSIETFVPSHQKFLASVHPEDKEKVEVALRDIFLTGELYSIDFRIVRVDGSHRYVRERAELEADGAGNPLRLIGTVQDITEYKGLEERFHTAQKLECVGRLAGGIAHDFNNLLTVINGYSSMLLRGSEADARTRSGLEEIKKAGEKASMLTQQLLAFSRKQVVQPRLLDLNSIVRDTERMLRRLIGENIALTSVLDPDLGKIKVDPGQLSQILLNLAVNARDAMPDGGSLTLETANIEFQTRFVEGRQSVVPGPYVLLAVSDTGTGMDEATRSRIFEPFFTTKGPGRGTGLGMATVYGIAEQCGGWVWVYSEPGKGTTVKVYFPRAGAALVVDEEVPALTEGLRGNETILVVEDQEEVRKFAVTVLSGAGYRILTAENGVAALKMCENREMPVDLLLTDVVMPGMSGRELSRRFRTVCPATKVLFMSGYTDNLAMLRNEVDADAVFLQKPFDPYDLAAAVRTLLGPPRSAPLILLATGENGVRTMVRHILATVGYDVLEVMSGSQMLVMANSGKVDLVITDLVTPEEEAFRRLRRTRPDLNVIAISDARSHAPSGATTIAGACVTLTKPIQPDVLLSAIRTTLRRKSFINLQD
jgi:two-component system, cell cycle sensor histidine kinase and response regulator CckA